MPAFIPGLELSRLFFAEVVQPLLGETFPTLRYAAGLLGSGSEVLGFDTEMSTDHNWGPRVDLFLDERAPSDLHRQIDGLLQTRLPRQFRGYSTHFSEPDPADHGTRRPEKSTTGPVRHKIAIQTPAGFFQSYLGFNTANAIETADWLTFPSQKLRTIAAGSIFRDDIDFASLRERFAFYPDDVWLYLLASGWARIGQEEHLMGRAGMVDDEIGSSIIAARLVRDLMRLSFLMERVYAPYPKWFGTAFQRLRCAPSLTPHLRAVLTSTTWRERERMLAAAYESVAAMHDRLGITDPLSTRVESFFGRPFQVIMAGRFADAITARIRDDSVRQLATRPLIGSVDQFSDSTDLLQNPIWRLPLRELYI